MDAVDQSKRIQERDRALHARHIFDNPLWDEAYTALVDIELARLLSPATDDEETLECKRRIMALHSVKRHFEVILETGKLAAMQLDGVERDGKQKAVR